MESHVSQRTRNMGHPSLVVVSGLQKARLSGNLLDHDASELLAGTFFSSLFVFSFVMLMAAVGFGQDEPGPERAGMRCRFGLGAGTRCRAGLRTPGFLMWGCGMGG